MKIYHTQAEIDADVKYGVLQIKGDVKFECSFKIEADLEVSGNINAQNITAHDINAWDIDAQNITAHDISFYAVAFAHVSFTCHTIVGRRENSKYFCLDSEVKTGVAKEEK